MASAGFDIGVSTTPITPVMLGEASLAQEVSRRLFDDEAVFAQAIGFPTVPRGKARLRVMVSAAHSHDDLARGAEAFGQRGPGAGRRPLARPLRPRRGRHGAPRDLPRPHPTSACSARPPAAPPGSRPPGPRILAAPHPEGP